MCRRCNHAYSKDDGRLPVRVFLTLPYKELEASAERVPDRAGETNTDNIAGVVGVVDGPTGDGSGLGEMVAGATASTASGQHNTCNDNRNSNGAQSALEPVGGSAEELEEERFLRPWLGDQGLLSWHRVKLFADGSLGE